MKFSYYLVSLALIASCGKKDDESTTKGAPLGAPELKPPVERNIPTGFSATTLRLEDGPGMTPKEQAITAIKSYLNPSANDAVGAIQRIASVDDRMKELDTRIQGTSLRKCIENDAALYKLSAALPGENTISLKMQCMDNLDGGTGQATESQLAFGLDTTNFYLYERAGGYNNAVLAIAPLNGKKSEIWQISTGQGDHYIHLIAEDSKGLEFTAASDSGASGGLGCGMHLKSSKEFIYVKGKFPEGPNCGTTEQEYCLNAADLTDATSLDDCQGINTFTLKSLTAEEIIAADGNASKIIGTPITGITDFMEESPNAKQ